MKAVIYARYSSDNQREESIEGQMRDCMQYAEYNDIQVVGSYIDRALSAKTDNRPNFQKMIKDSAKRIFDVIIVWKLDRFARNRYDSATYKAKLKKNGVRVLSAKENITDDASGILIEGVLESMAEYYSAELSQKVKRGIAMSAAKCKYFGGVIPLGYKVNSEKSFVLDEELAPIVKTVFEMFVAGSNYAELIRYLNGRGVKTTKGGEFNKNSFQRILSNRRYLGKYIYQGNEIDGGMPRIIDDELFEQAQQKLALYAAAPARGKAKVEYILSEKLICGKCSNKMTGVSAMSKNKTLHNYYKCVGVTKHTCDKRTVRKQFIENEIITAITGDGTERNKYGILTDEFIDMVAAETYTLIQAARNDSEIKRLENIIEDNKKAIDNLMQALMHGKATDIILSQVERLENENKELADTVAMEKAMQMKYSYSDIRKWLLHFRTLDYSKTKHRKELINIFIYRIVLYDDKMKVLFHLKGGQKEELLLNLIFPNYPDGNGENESETEQSAKEKEADKSTSLSGCSYTPRLVTSTEMNPNPCKWIIGVISIFSIKFIKVCFCN